MLCPKNLEYSTFHKCLSIKLNPKEKNTTAATWALRACWEAPCAETGTWGLGNGPRLRELGDAFGYPDYSMMISVFLSHPSHLSHLSSVFLLCFPPKLDLARLNWDILAAAEHGDLQGSGIDQKYGDPFCYNKDIGSLDDMGMVHHWKDQRMMLKWCLWSQWWFEEMTTWRPWLSRRPWTPWRYSGQLFLLPSSEEWYMKQFWKWKRPLFYGKIIFRHLIHSKYTPKMSRVAHFNDQLWVWTQVDCDQMGSANLKHDQPSVASWCPWLNP